ncbi:hypothetical protein OTU49_000126, partial [Cherax quadricarinatus]
MLAKMDDAGWESVANVRFQPLPGATPVHVQTEDEADTVTTPPPPDFMPAPPPQFDNSPVESEESAPPSLDTPTTHTTTTPNIILNTASVNSNINTQETRPTKQYVYGITDATPPPKEMRTARIVETVAKKPASQENVIEAEIRAQQLKEVAMRQEGTLKSTSSSSSTTTTTTTVVREKGASSPASHDSDEGFVDRLVEDVPITPTSGYTHTIAGNDGEPVIYDTVSPPPEYFSE